MSKKKCNDGRRNNRPPKKNQFKKGKSGNPNGRPKRKNLKVSLKDIVNEEVTVQVNGAPKNMTTYELVQRKLVSMAAKGDKAAIKQLHTILMDTGVYKQDIDDFEKCVLRYEDEDIIIINDEVEEED